MAECADVLYGLGVAFLLAVFGYTIYHCYTTDGVKEHIEG